MKKEIEVRITGRVQGVMFRDFAQRKARGLGVVGTVQNMKDGSVRVIALGDEASLLAFIEKLGRRPLLSRMVSRVDAKDVVWRDPVHNFTGFDIVYTYGE